MRKLIFVSMILGLVLVGGSNKLLANTDTDPPTGPQVVNRFNTGSTEMATIETSTGQLKTGVVISEAQGATGSTITVQVEIGLVVCADSGPF